MTRIRLQFRYIGIPGTLFILPCIMLGSDDSVAFGSRCFGGNGGRIGNEKVPGDREVLR